MKTLSFNKFFVVLLFLSASILSLKAQKGDPNADRNDSHFFTLSLSGGVSSYNLMPSLDTMKISPFLGGMFGLGYEWQHTSGLWLGVGLEGQVLTSKLKNTQDIYRIDNAVDSENDTSDIDYTLVTWKEMQRVLSVNLPIMVGYKLESGFYFGAGLKVGLSVYADITSNFQFTDCTVCYKQYPPMSLKELVSGKTFDITSADRNFVGRLQLSPAIEIGWQGLDLKPQDKYSGSVRFKFAVCGEFGVLSAYSSPGGGNLLNYNDMNGYDDLMKVKDLLKGINSYYSTQAIGVSSAPSLRSWYAGVKFGILFEMPKRKGCNCLNNDVIKPWMKNRKNKGVE